MAMFKKSTFSLVLLALTASTANGDINFMQCNNDNSQLTADSIRSAAGTGFTTALEGSERTTYSNLCGGTGSFVQDQTSSTNNNIDARVGHPFSKFCDLIDRWDSVQNLLSRGQAPHTVFAPTDAAFSKVEGLITRVNELRLLELHILPQARLAKDLRCGQTYRTLNTLQDRRNNQRSKTRCVSALRSQQLGPGNTINGLRPTMGVPNNIFRVAEFGGQDDFLVSINDNQATAADRETFSQDVVSCNGVIHVVDEVLLPGNANDFTLAGVNPPPYGYNQYSAYAPSYQGYMGSYYGGGGNYYGGPSQGVVGAVYYNSYSYYGLKNSKAFKGGKGGKGGKGFRGPRRRPYYYNNPNYYFRNLKGVGSEEKTMSDADFFGVDGLADIEAKIESVKDEFAEKPDENRKRRLEAMLEADGSVKV